MRATHTRGRIVCNNANTPNIIPTAEFGCERSRAGDRNYWLAHNFPSAMSSRRRRTAVNVVIARYET